MDFYLDIQKVRSGKLYITHLKVIRLRLMQGPFFCYLSLSGARLSFITYA